MLLSGEKPKQSTASIARIPLAFLTVHPSSHQAGLSNNAVKNVQFWFEVSHSVNKIVLRTIKFYL